LCAIRPKSSGIKSRAITSMLISPRRRIACRAPNIQAVPLAAVARMSDMTGLASVGGDGPDEIGQLHQQEQEMEERTIAHADRPRDEPCPSRRPPRHIHVAPYLAVHGAGDVAPVRRWRAEAAFSTGAAHPGPRL